MGDFDSITFARVISIIENAADFEMEEILQAVHRRYQKFYPDWEVLYIACPKNDPAQRQQTLERIQEHFCNNP